MMIMMNQRLERVEDWVWLETNICCFPVWLDVGGNLSLWLRVFGSDFSDLVKRLAFGGLVRIPVFLLILIAS